MNRTLVALGVVAVAGMVGCRTNISSYTKPPPNLVYVGDKSCNVYDFSGATDVPEGAKNIGWIEVDKAESDDDTFVQLRQKICEQGGDALSQAAWVHKPGEYEPTTLRANAWVLP